jgi:YidC/Oxa1 family membrane protein insertase
VHQLERYQEVLSISRFDLVIDWGWFPFLTKPIFIAIDYFNRVLGNFGLAILLFTVLMRILFFPLANKSFRSMGAMKKLQPEMVKMKERFGSDKAKLNQAMMELYKKEKVNPMAGCLPIALQIPVFFALYKVLFVTIEMRHAPFYGWIHDLSAPDPTNFFTLLGLIPWDPPQMLHLGVWPLAMGISMFLQQKLNPPPADPVQAKVFMMLPIVFTFLLANFPAGLVIYWTWNNVLSMAQQWVIQKRVGTAPAAAKKT